MSTSLGSEHQNRTVHVLQDRTDYLLSTSGGTTIDMWNDEVYYYGVILLPPWLRYYYAIHSEKAEFHDP
jgi:hypothetical protein